MSDALKDFGRRAIAGEDDSWPARLARVAATVVEPGYATAMRLRNRLYDLGLRRTHDLGRPTVSVGNLTTGGTGKTPLVAWLATALRADGRNPAVLLRGYGAAAGQDGDEARALRRALGPGVPVRADPSRVAGAASVLRDHPSVDLFLLDDAFQHRRAARQVDLVVISSTDPFGHGHVLPRGLLREPLSGLRRATAVVLTRCDAATDDQLAAIERVVRRHHATVPMFRTDHVHAAVWSPSTDVERPATSLSDGPFFAVAAIGDPAALDRQLRAHGDRYVGHRWFADHHRYTSADVAEIRSAAGSATIVTTEKDWVKLADVPEVAGGPFLVLRLALRFHRDDEAGLLRLVAERLHHTPRQ
jgi:tetraacyldisaccharide 4'-kinase